MNNEDLKEEQPEEEDLKPESTPIAPADPKDSVTFSRARMAYQTSKSRTSGLKDKKAPQRVVTSHLMPTEPLTADDIDDDTLIAPGKRVIGKAYASTGELKGGGPKAHTPVAESTTGSDILALQAADERTGQTISFKVKGIQWKAGWSPDFSKTPLGHAIHPLELPPPSNETPEALQKAGIVIRAVNPRLQIVLSQLLPSTFRKTAFKARRKADKLKQLAIFYLPTGQSSYVGFVHEFISAKGGEIFFLYIQTSVGKAPVAILDEVLKTLEAGLPEGEKAEDFEYEEEDVPIPEAEFDFVSEVEQSMKQASSAMQDSIMVHIAKQSGFILKNWFGDFLRWLDKTFARFIRILTAIVVWIADSWMIRGLAGVLNFFGNIFVQIIWGINRFLLAVGRSFVVKAIIDGIGWFFKVISKVFGLIGEGVGFIGQLISGFFHLIGTLFTAPGELLSEIPKIKIGNVEFFGPKPKREKSKLTAKTVSKSAPPPAPVQKPVSKGFTSPIKPQSPSAPPQLTSNLRKMSKAPPPPPKKRPMGYFEDDDLKR